MSKLHFTIDINASADKVWHTMLDKETYRQWTVGFNPAGESYYEGAWEKGTKIHFIGPDENGQLGGMVSKVVDARPGEYVSVETIGLVKPDGSEDLDSEEAKTWIGGTESYTFTENNGVTTVQVDLDGNEMPEEFVDMFSEAWPKALARLKELAEK